MILHALEERDAGHPSGARGNAIPRIGERDSAKSEHGHFNGTRGCGKFHEPNGSAFAHGFENGTEDREARFFDLRTHHLFHRMARYADQKSGWHNAPQRGR